MLEALCYDSAFTHARYLNDHRGPVVRLLAWTPFSWLMHIFPAQSLSASCHEAHFRLHARYGGMVQPAYNMLDHLPYNIAPKSHFPQQQQQGSRLAGNVPSPGPQEVVLQRLGDHPACSCQVQQSAAAAARRDAETQLLFLLQCPVHHVIVTKGHLSKAAKD